MTRWRTIGLAALGAGLLSAVALGPMVRHPRSTLCAYAHPGDAMVSIWSTWVRLAAHAGRWPLNHIPLVEAPHGTDFRQYPPEPAIEWPQLLLARWIGDVGAFNLHLWLTFPLAAATMALLIWELAGSPAAASVGGLLYACAPYHFAHTMQLSLASIQWLPLGLWSWLRLWRAPNAGRAALHVMCLGLVMWTTAYYALLLGIASAAWLLGLAWDQRARPPLRRFVGWAVGSVTATALLSLAWYAPFLARALTRTAVPFAQRYEWPIKHLFVYCAKPWDYLLPSVHHPWLGPLLRPLEGALLYGSNVVEQTLYLGYGALGLAGWIVMQRGRRRLADPRLAQAVLCGAILALVGLWCSAPPYLPIGSFRLEHDQVLARAVLPFPSWGLYTVMPFFRVYARFGILVTLGVSVLAGIGWSQLARRAMASPRRGRWVALGALSALLVAEYSVAMPFYDAGHRPAVYTWLAAYPGDPIVLEYPYLPSSHSIHAEYLFAQRYHGKRLFNGGPTTGAAEARRQLLADIMAPGVIQRLRTLGVNLIIVHHDQYRAIPPRPAWIRILGVTYRVPPRHLDESLPPPPQTIPGLRLIASFDEAIVYRPEV